MNLDYQLDGPDGAPVIVLSNSLGTTRAMWQPQIEALTAHFRVLRYDNRLLFSTRETDDALLGQRLPGALFISRLRDSESGSGVQFLEDERPCLAAFRASKRYPVVVMAQAPQAVLLEGWLEQNL